MIGRVPLTLILDMIDVVKFLRNVLSDIVEDQFFPVGRRG
jgi:hypothetical protein